MKKVVGLIGGLVLVAAVALAGVKTDKIVFGDDTEMTTASGGGVTNSLDDVVAVGNSATNGSLVATLVGTYAGEFADATRYAQLIDSGNSRAGYFGNGTFTVTLCDDYAPISVTGGDIEVPSTTYGIALGTTQDARIQFNGSGLYISSTGNTEDDYLVFSSWDDVSVATGDFMVNDAGQGQSTVRLGMDDAAGTDCTFVEWCIGVGAAADQNNNWRMGVVNSNLVVQVRVSGVWTNATTFQRP